jgi:hypothetical protein
VTTRQTLLRNLVASMVVLAGGGATFAADVPPANHAAPTKEMREKMATLHEQMAACLRSDKPIADCRSEMKKSCGETMGEEGCPKMDGMHHRMMKDQSSVPPKQK